MGEGQVGSIAKSQGAKKRDDVFDLLKSMIYCSSVDGYSANRKLSFRKDSYGRKVLRENLEKIDKSKALAFYTDGIHFMSNGYERILFYPYSTKISSSDDIYTERKILEEFILGSQRLVSEFRDSNISLTKARNWGGESNKILDIIDEDSLQWSDHLDSEERRFLIRKVMQKISRLYQSKQPPKWLSDSAMSTKVIQDRKVGGIDMATSKLDLAIRRDKKGFPLPMSQQDLPQLSQVKGFIPVIVGIKSMIGLPFLQNNR